MEDAGDHGALHEPDHAGANHGVGVDAGVLHAGHVVEVEAVEPLHHEHPRGDERGMGTGDDVAPLSQLHEAAGHVQHVLGLEAEVQLLADRLGEQLDQRRRVGQGGEGEAPDEERGEPRHHLEVLGDERSHRGALDLDDHPLAGSEGCRVDLGDRRGGQRGAFEVGEDILEGSSELALDGGPDRAERFRGHLVAALLELAHQLFGEQALTRGDDLAELDVRRSEVFGGDAQPAGQVGPAGGAVLTATSHPPQAHGRAEATDDGEDPAAPGEATGSDQVGEALGGDPPDLVDGIAPGHGGGVDDPRGGGGEGADGEVGGPVVGTDGGQRFGGSGHRRRVYGGLPATSSRGARLPEGEQEEDWRSCDRSKRRPSRVAMPTAGSTRVSTGPIG